MPEQGLQNRFDAPIPGESLTDTPGNAKWEHPPQFTKVEEASEYIWDRLHDEKLLEQVIAMLREGVPVEAIVDAIFWDIKPDFPIPETMRRPLHSNMVCTADSNC